MACMSADKFVSACYKEHFIQDFDWGEWVRQYESELESDNFIRAADLVTIVRMLTAHIRGDRFCDGHLLSVMDNGTIGKILNRLHELDSEAGGEA